MIHNLLLELVVLPNVLALALHQVNYFGWMDQGEVWVAHVILESAQGPNPFFFFLFDFYSTWEPVRTRIWTRA